MLGAFAERFAGSSDLFRHGGRKPTASINYVAAHDGFTLHDAVSYNDRHNEDNLDGGTDGHAHNLSTNCGVEGPTDDPEVCAKRGQMMRNLLSTLFLSQGVPMLQAGDEIGRTQRGNNNGYCQDNEISWVDWNLAEQNAGLLEFVRKLIDLRRSRLWLRRDTFLKGTTRAAGSRDVTWLNMQGQEMRDSDWNNAALGSLAVLMSSPPSPREDEQKDLLIVFNADVGSQEFLLPIGTKGAGWRVVLDTAVTAPDETSAHLRPSETMRVAPLSTVLLELSGPHVTGSDRNSH
jgi:glycogen operon protein